MRLFFLLGDFLDLFSEVSAHMLVVVGLELALFDFLLGLLDQFRQARDLFLVLKLKFAGDLLGGFVVGLFADVVVFFSFLGSQRNAIRD